VTQIVIGTSPGREPWLMDCLNSLQKPCLILRDLNYELGKLKWCQENLKNPFFFFQDSVVFKSTSWIDEASDKYLSVSLNSDPDLYGTYMGIYDPKVLRQIDVPIPKSKAEAIEFELSWTKKYVDQVGSVEVLFPELKDANAQGIEMRHGRENLILENEYLIKYKGNWGQKPALD
jgi:hypothetical protein